MYCNAVQNSEGSDVTANFNFLLARYEEIADSDLRGHEFERNRLLDALACPDDVALVERYLPSNWSIHQSNRVQGKAGLGFIKPTDRQKNKQTNKQTNRQINK